MSWWERIVSVFRRESSDVREGLKRVGESLDEELARKERELAASPQERIDMILEEQAAEDARFDDLTDRIRGEGGADGAPPGPDPT